MWWLLLQQVQQDTKITVDLTDLLNGVVAIVVALIGAGVIARRTLTKNVKPAVSDAVESTVTAHTNAEEENQRAIQEELRLIRLAQQANNELFASYASTTNRRLDLFDDRLGRIEAAQHGTEAGNE